MWPSKTQKSWKTGPYLTIFSGKCCQIQQNSNILINRLLLFWPILIQNFLFDYCFKIYAEIFFRWENPLMGWTSTGTRMPMLVMLVSVSIARKQQRHLLRNMAGNTWYVHSTNLLSIYTKCPLHIKKLLIIAYFYKNIEEESCLGGHDTDASVGLWRECNKFFSL